MQYCLLSFIHSTYIVITTFILHVNLINVFERIQNEHYYDSANSIQFKPCAIQLYLVHAA